MWESNALTELLHLRYPIIQAPMAGVTTPELTTAVSNAGALGSHGCAMHSPATLEKDLASIREGTNATYNINFFVHPEPEFNPKESDEMRALLTRPYAELGLEVPEASPPIPTFNQDHLNVLLHAPPTVISFHFGLPAQEMVDELKGVGCRLLACATTVEEARVLEDRGADAIIAQGYEAGGHRGTFISAYEAGNIGTLALVPMVVDTVAVPVIAAGGIMDGRGIAAALMLGASGVQLGTAFLTCPEATTTTVHRNALIHQKGIMTALTTAFSGRPARGVENQFMREMAGHEDLFPPFPIPNGLTGPLRKASAIASNPDFLPLWAGQAYPLIRTLPAADLVETLVTQTHAALSAIGGNQSAH